MRAAGSRLAECASEAVAVGRRLVSVAGGGARMLRGMRGAAGRLRGADVSSVGGR